MTDENLPLAIITGANRGIGKATAAALLQKNWRVVMMCRDGDSAEEARRDVDQSPGQKNSTILPIDLADPDSIHNAVVDFTNRFGRLDALINNAAIVSPTRVLTPSGQELQFAVNHLAPFLLTSLLRDTLTQQQHARVITVSSRAHILGRMNFDDLTSASGYQPARAYRQSKLANILFTREAARRLQGTGVTVNCVHPGVVMTNVLGGLTRLPSSLRWLFKPFTVSPEQAAAGSIRLATDPALATVTGAYFDQETQVEPAAHAMNDEDALRLWDVSAHLTGIKPWGS